MSEQLLNELAEQFLAPLENRLGSLARANGTFFSYQVATLGLQRIRLDLLRGGHALTRDGGCHVLAASAFLARLMVQNWRRRGLEVTAVVSNPDNLAAAKIMVSAKRFRDGKEEYYQHDVYRDVFELLLMPPQMFPTLHGYYYGLTSLTLPAPEYLYLYSAFLMGSQRSSGDWPRGTRVGGLDEDFETSKRLLVDDLHSDCGLPLDDQALRQLSWWVVFPPYGWEMNDGQDYNMMTLFSQISHKQIVSLEQGVAYLRALLNSQALFIRNLAARCLMVYRVPPRNEIEALCYSHALGWQDYPIASSCMAKYQWQLEGHDPEQAPSEQWLQEVEAERRAWIDQLPAYAWEDDPVFTDPAYTALGELAEEKIQEAVFALERLMERYPASWALKTLHASQLMNGPDPERGEKSLRSLIQNPASAEAHLRLGTMLKRQRRFDEAMAVFENAVQRWPLHAQAVDSCIWLVTEGMTVVQNDG
ncbi:MAG: tetratricopeptide repeat protein [Bdellovibrionales bacterium]|nr:tetratricopeptide repeat protein [Bdellovibrionales bacterium]